MTASLTILTAGYVGPRTASTVSLLRDGDTVVVVDPGTVADRKLILDPLAEAGIRPDQVTDVVFSHHHPDHTINAALFPAARYHDHWAIYEDDLWIDRPADGFEISPSIRLAATPGHTVEDISTLADTADGLVVLTHLWWSAEGPVEDPYATDPDALHASRRAVLDLEPALIVPGHGVAFAPTADTPR
ncbi:MBL fold metallo-hydrolase [Streptomyces sp. Je 1-79]|uniref:MBL fold metallo-hydrolase n=1 Tax=Streptomyces sp. Je 1-79 TaxID=2943847 RepID=UPI0021A43031|nr:MBL fold metallo-hydrolase [Streptomyces sp. Je 1-79]MCT4351920.1 MBL fold metallo-hydrolase [Streptomyces sp. Je 1-79]